MINPKLSSGRAKNPPILVLDLIKLQIVKKIPLLKTLKHFYKIARSFITWYQVTKEKMQTKHFLFTLTGGL